MKASKYDDVLATGMLLLLAWFLMSGTEQQHQVWIDIEKVIEKLHPKPPVYTLGKPIGFVLPNGHAVYYNKKDPAI